jgi:hypothetical protein
MSKFIEVDVKNKKHTECCDVLGTAIIEIEKYQDTLEGLRKNEMSTEVNSQIDDKITDLRFKKVVLKDKAKRCGCREPAYQPRK